jgi:hypothetical protein
MVPPVTIKPTLDNAAILVPSRRPVAAPAPFLFPMLSPDHAA